MLLLEKNGVPFGIKVNADEFFRALRDAEDIEIEFSNGRETVWIDLLADELSFNNNERTVLIKPTCDVEEWLDDGNNSD